ncbi:MAG: GlcNAc-PI de-N-acetylase [Candidatus Marinimicrobia bacterium]|nr:GlcNAc-PI de-N-acetylase [Candidatus Neomarinimicrobiota bacterium]
MMKYLIIAAHPDDEILGCGGSIAKWTHEGNDVHILIMAEGATSRDFQRDRNVKQTEISDLKSSAKAASKILGVKSIDFADYPDNRMDSIDLLDVVKSVENKIDLIEPDVVITHHIGDLNIDHQIIHRAVTTACRPQPNQFVKFLLSFEVASSTEWQSPSANLNFNPNWFEDISSTLNLKLNALEVYSSEMRDWPHSRSLKAVDHLAKWRGATVGIEAAEAFMLIKKIG